MIMIAIEISSSSKRVIGYSIFEIFKTQLISSNFLSRNQSY